MDEDRTAQGESVERAALAHQRTAAGSPYFAEMAVRGTDSGAGWPGSELGQWRTPLGVRDEAPKTGGRCSPAGRLGGSTTSDCAREEPREREGKVASGVPYPALELRRWLVGTRKERGGGSSGERWAGRRGGTPLLHARCPSLSSSARHGGGLS